MAVSQAPPIPTALRPHHFGTCEPPGLAVGRVGLLAGRARRADVTKGGALAPETTLLPPPVAVVLHFHCASLPAWQAKFSDHVAALQRLGSGGGSGGGSGRRSLDDLEATLRGCLQRELESLLGGDKEEAESERERSGEAASGDSSSDEPLEPGTEAGAQAGGEDLPAMATSVHAFHEASAAAAAALAAAEEKGEPDAVAHAALVSRRVWERWRVQPAGLPSLGDAEPHRVLDCGVTLIRPLRR